MSGEDLATLVSDSGTASRDSHVSDSSIDDASVYHHRPNPATWDSSSEHDSSPSYYGSSTDDNAKSSGVKDASETHAPSHRKHPTTPSRQHAPAQCCDNVTSELTQKTAGAGHVSLTVESLD